MIPTLLLVGLVLGTWWRVVIPVATFGWATLLVVTDIGSGPAFVVGAALFGLLNVTVGVLVHQALRASLQGARHRFG